jgi:FtsZ-binding cell division protein ZapB
MISDKPDFNTLPIYFMFEESGTVNCGNVREEVRQSLKTYDIAFRRMFKGYESAGRVNEPLAKIIRNGIDSVAELEFFTHAVFDELEALKEYSDKLKQQNEQLRERNYELKLENQQLKF